MITVLSEYIADPIELRKQCSNSSFNSTDRSFSLSTITVVICVCRFRTNRKSTCNCGCRSLCSYLNRNVSSKGQSMDNPFSLISILIWIWFLVSCRFSKSNDPSNMKLLATFWLGNITFISLDVEDMIWEMSFSVFSESTRVFVDPLPIFVLLKFSSTSSIFFQSSSTISSLATRIWRHG